MIAIPSIPFDMAPYVLSGMVYGTLVNHRSSLAEIGEDAARPPYDAPPRAPVLFIKPHNTLVGDGDRIEIPPGVEELETGASLGIVIGRTACRVTAEQARDYIAGYLIVNDVSVPHDTFYRPSIRLKAGDGFCPLGPRVAAPDSLADADALTLRTYVDGELMQTATTADSLRSVGALLSAVTEFMTLSPGDVLTLGSARPAPRVRPGQTVRIEIGGLGSLSNFFVAAS